MPQLFNYAIVEWPHMAAQIAGRNGPVVVVYEGGRTVAASAPLADWRAGMPLGRARRLYAQATFVRRDRAREKATHTALSQRLARFSPRQEAIRPGCFLLQGPDIDNLAGFLTQHDELCSAAAPYSEWARLAVCTATLGTLRLVYDGAAFLDETPVSILASPGGPLDEHGPDIAQRLELFGLRDLGMARRRLNRRHLRVQFGPYLGARIDSLLRPSGQPAVPIYAYPREVQAAYELDKPSPMEKPWIKGAILRLAERLAKDLQGMAALTLALYAFAPNHGVVSDRYLSRRGLSSASDLQRLTSHLYERLCAKLAAVQAEALSLRLVAGGITQLAYAQGRLFSTRRETPALQRAVRLLQQRYGQQAILHAQRKDSLLVEDRLALTPLRWDTP